MSANDLQVVVAASKLWFACDLRISRHIIVVFVVDQVLLGVGKIHQKSSLVT